MKTGRTVGAVAVTIDVGGIELTGGRPNRAAAENNARDKLGRGTSLRERLSTTGGRAEKNLLEAEKGREGE